MDRRERSFQEQDVTLSASVTTTPTGHMTQPPRSSARAFGRGLIPPDSNRDLQPLAGALPFELVGRALLKSSHLRRT